MRFSPGSCERHLYCIRSTMNAPGRSPGADRVVAISRHLVWRLQREPHYASISMVRQRFQSAYAVANGHEPDYTCPTPLYRGPARVMPRDERPCVSQAGSIDGGNEMWRVRSTTFSSIQRSRWAMSPCFDDPPTQSTHLSVGSFWLDGHLAGEERGEALKHGSSRAYQCAFSAHLSLEALSWCDERSCRDWLLTPELVALTNR